MTKQERIKVYKQALKNIEIENGDDFICGQFQDISGIPIFKQSESNFPEFYLFKPKAEDQFYRTISCTWFDTHYKNNIERKIVLDLCILIAMTD